MSNYFNISMSSSDENDAKEVENVEAGNFRNADENEEPEIVHEIQSDIDNVDDAMDEDDIREEPFNNDDNDYVNEDRMPGENESLEESGSSDEEHSEDNNNLATPRRRLKTPAPIWKCAERVEDGAGAKCKFCSMIIKTSDGSTSSITRHVNRKHPEKREVKEMSKLLELNKKSKKIKKNENMKKTKRQPSMINFTTRVHPAYRELLFLQTITI